MVGTNPVRPDVLGGGDQNRLLWNESMSLAPGGIPHGEEVASLSHAETLSDSGPGIGLDGLESSLRLLVLRESSF